MVAIADGAGNILVQYYYDAWGRILEIDDDSTNSIGTINPIRYRSYYYDTETGFYYLKTRYYSPEICRFLSPDSVIDDSSVNTQNLFSYCANNPIMREDSGGQFWNFVVGGIVGAVVGGVVAALNGENAAGIIIGTLAGVASGLVAATGLGIIAQAGISAAISASADIAKQTVDIVQSNGTIAEYNIIQTVTEAGLGFATSVAGSMLGNVVNTNITKTTIKSNELFDQYLGKTFTANIRKEIGKSTSSLLRQANQFLKQSNLYQNISRGVSSVIGSGLSLWNLAR